MNEEPQECPFCGGSVRMVHMHSWHVMCLACAIMGKGNRKGGRAFAIKFWNTRHNKKEQDHE